ncbi:hypothetical protein Pelo_6762 [Pelomyxa schiedti]|nr:hypothetical protein Pelo_6762 [Pelomyxa schiedti]
MSDGERPREGDVARSGTEERGATATATSTSTSSSASVGEGGGSVDVFEVFRCGSATRNELMSTPEAQLKRTYTMLVPVTSHDQIMAPGCALACVPKPGHMVIDQGQYEAKVRDTVARVMSQKAGELRAQRDERVCTIADKLLDFSGKTKQIVHRDVEVLCASVDRAHEHLDRIQQNQHDSTEPSTPTSELIAMLRSELQSIARVAKSHETLLSSMLPQSSE